MLVLPAHQAGPLAEMPFDRLVGIGGRADQIDHAGGQCGSLGGREQHRHVGAIGRHRKRFDADAGRQILEFESKLAAEIDALGRDQHRQAIALRHGERGVDILRRSGRPSVRLGVTGVTSMR